jgi:hypothetical protein
LTREAKDGGRGARFFAALKDRVTRRAGSSRPTGLTEVQKKKGGRFVNRPYGFYPGRMGDAAPYEVDGSSGWGDGVSIAFGRGKWYNI